MVRRLYCAEDIDAFAVYCAEVDRCFFVPMDAVGGQSWVQLRLTKARNNQSRRVRWADDFDFRRLDWTKIGAIAQLGERLAGSQKVTGSNPVGSITQPAAFTPDAALVDTLAARRLAS